MPASDSRSGLMKWLRREPWSSAFGELLERHLGPACDKAGVPLEELSEVIGDHWTMTLWGCAFEDFLTREVEGVGNIVDDYLKRRGWNETAMNRADMTALRSSVISLYEASDIRPGESFLARDLIRGGEPVRVSERTATRPLVQARPAAQVLLDHLPLELDRVGPIPGHLLIPRGPLSLPHSPSRSCPAVRGHSRMGRTLSPDQLALLGLS